MIKTCSMEGCSKPVWARGFCESHYKRLRNINWDVDRWLQIESDTKVRKEKGHIDGEGYRIVAGKREHISIAEKALGKSLPYGAEVHHVNGDKTDNKGPWNLVICPDRSYHRLLEMRTQALEACGNASYRRCYICKRYDDPFNLRTTLTTIHHIKCYNEYYKELKQERLDGLR